MYKNLTEAVFYCKNTLDKFFETPDYMDIKIIANDLIEGMVMQSSIYEFDESELTEFENATEKVLEIDKFLQEKFNPEQYAEILNSTVSVYLMHYTGLDELGNT